MQTAYSKIFTRFRVCSLTYAFRNRGLNQVALSSSHSARIGSYATPIIITRNMSSSSPVYTVEYLSDKLKNDLNAEHIDMKDLSNCGCGMKFDAVIVSTQFEGKPILQRQRLVNQILSEEMKHIHAFTMRTLTPSQFKGTEK